MVNIMNLDGFKYSLIKSGFLPENFYYVSISDRPITIDFSHHKTCAQLSGEAYNFDKEWAKDYACGLLRVKEYDTTNSNTGFQGCVYANDKVVIISYRGTDREWADIDNDWQMFKGNCPSQYKDALDLYKRVKSDERFKDKKILITGHSLGGSLAQLVASTPGNQDKNNDVTAITFNSYGQEAFIRDDAVFVDFDNSINYVVNDDFVGSMREHPGKVCIVQVDGSETHTIDNFLEAKNEPSFRSAYEDSKNTSFDDDNSLNSDDEPSLLSTIVSGVCNFFCDCGRAIASFFGYGDESDSRRRLA